MASVTIGLPVYNGARYLDGALESLCAQTFTDLKILISDNASTDETSAIIQKWAEKDKRVEYHRQPDNIGVMANFEWVLNNADSRWFCFAAYDDLWSPDYIRLLYEAVTAKPGLLLAAPRLVTMFEDGRQDNSSPFVEEIKNGRTRLSRIAAALKWSHSTWYNGLFDRAALISALKETQGFKHTWGVDFITILPPIFSCSVTGSDTAIYYKRQTPGSDERYRPKTSRDQFVIYRDTLKELFKLLKTAPLSCMEKAFLLPRLIRYARKIQKPKRILRAFMKEAMGLT